MMLIRSLPTVSSLALSVLLSIVVASSPTLVLARPTNLQEASSSNWRKFWTGTYVGLETILDLAGYYDEDEDDSIDNEVEETRSPTTIQVAVVGLGRTGSTSLALALELLGYAVIHDDEHLELQDLYEAEEEEEITWDEFHEKAGQRGFNATFKSGYKWAADHPEVKSILTVRDTPDKYVDSWLAAVKFIDILRRPPYCWMEATKKLMPSFEEEYLDATTEGNRAMYLDRDTLRKGYIDHSNKVKEAIPSNRLLVFNVKQGWKPLCDYLEVNDCPTIPFPHVHDRMKLQGEMYVYKLLTWIWPLGPLLALMFLCVLGHVVARMYKVVQSSSKVHDHFVSMPPLTLTPASPLRNRGHGNCNTMPLLTPASPLKNKKI